MPAFAGMTRTSMTVPAILFDQLDELIASALKQGADAADAVIGEGRSLTASMRGGKLDTLEESQNLALSLRVLIGRQQASLSTQDVRRESFKELAARAVAMARAAPEDPYAGLADKTDLARDFPDLDLADTSEGSGAKLIEAARELEAFAREEKNIANIEEAIASWGESSSALAASNGFKGGARATGHALSIALVAGSGTEMVRDYDHAEALHEKDLRGAKDVAEVAAQRTASRLHARKMGTGKMPVVFAPRVANGLLRNFLGAINGQSVARKSTFLLDAMGTDVFGAGVNIIDDPLRKRGLRSRPFDGEGLATKKTVLVENGRLISWMLNCASARQLNLKPTGHAARGAGAPGIAPSNAYIEAGKLAPEELIGNIKEGFYVIETMGFGVNPLTGDYSQGAAGFWIEQGKIAFPVHEMTIAGNLKDMFRNLTPANDLVFRYGVDAPTLRVESMMVAGS